jgi:hypothetical protein
MGIMRTVILFLVVLSILSCTSEKSSEKRSDMSESAPQGTEPSGETGKGGLPAGVPDPKQPFPAGDVWQSAFKIVPLEPVKGGMIQVVHGGLNPADIHIEWLVDGRPRTSLSPGQFQATEVQKGSTIQARAVIDGNELISNTVIVKNAAPEVRNVKLLPEVFKPGDLLRVEVTGFDIDGDEVTINYEWTKNGEPAGHDATIDLPVKRGDSVSVRVTPYDGEESGRSVDLERDITNLPPMILEHVEAVFDEKNYSYQVRAADPDGDPLTFKLSKAPEGMVINENGLITWSVGAEVEGNFPVEVRVSDDHGGESVYSFAISITTEEAEKAVVKE